MAIVKKLIQPEEAQFLAANFPQLIKQLGSNFPVASLAYDAAAKETAFWKLKASNYGSGNLSLVIDWSGDTATSGDVIWGAQIAVITPDTDTQDVTTKAFATANTVTDTHLGTTAKRIMRTTITITNLDSLIADDEFYLAIFRDAAQSGDTMTGDAHFLLGELSYSDT